ncbi:MAG: 50S ribosomal protein L6 [Candidatus Pacebacteria bacterium]|nr:50S ribosomal protein L6 [Candidatus Paceibacterota bacterium]
MSRIAKQPIEIPSGTTITFVDGLLTVKGAKGTLTRAFRNEVDFKIEGNTITLSPAKDEIFARALWGTYASHVKNMITGVNTPYVKKLILEGVGFKSEVKGKDLVLALGFSHGVTVAIPEGLTVTAEKNNITFTGIDKESVGQFASKIRAMKKPEPYKGKGFRYDDEVIRRKQGKKAA